MTAASTTSAFSIGDVLGRSCRILGRNFVAFFVIAFGTQLVSLAIQWLAGVPLSFQQALEPQNNTVLTSILPSVLGILVYAITFSAVIFGAFRELEGARASLAEMLAKAPPHILRLIALYIVLTIAFIIGFVLLIVPGLWLVTRYFAAAPAVVVERKGVFAGMSRSVALTDGRKWQVFALIVILIVIMVGLGGIASALNIAFFFAGGGGFIVFMIATMAVYAVLLAFSAVVSVVTYHDLRKAKEGFTSEQIAAVFD